jgi:hypothetical protein
VVVVVFTVVVGAAAAAVITTIVHGETPLLRERPVCGFTDLETIPQPQRAPIITECLNMQTPVLQQRGNIDTRERGDTSTQRRRVYSHSKVGC